MDLYTLNTKILKGHFKLMKVSRKIYLIHRQLKYHQFRIRGEICISLEIVLNPVNNIRFHRNPHFGYIAIFIYFMSTFYYLLRNNFFLRGQMYTAGSTFIKKIEPFVCHYISMPR